MYKKHFPKGVLFKKKKKSQNTSFYSKNKEQTQIRSTAGHAALSLSPVL